MSSILGAAWGTIVGASQGVGYHVYSNAASTTDIKAANYAAAFRFTAMGTGDIHKVQIAVTTMPSDYRCAVEIWTIDTATGKPSAIYDAKATKTATGALTANAMNEFDWSADPPTTGLTAGAEYAIVVRTTTASASATNLAYSGGNYTLFGAKHPSVYFTSTDGSAWTEVSNSGGNCIWNLIDENGVEYGQLQAHPFISALTTGNIYAAAGTNYYVGAKIVMPFTAYVRGVGLYLVKNGTPAATADVRCRIINSANTLITGTDRTIPQIDLATANRGVFFCFQTPVLLTKGQTYRVIFSSVNSANTSNCWRVNAVVPFSATAVNYTLMERTSGTSADDSTIPSSWTDASASNYACVPVQLFVDSIPALETAHTWIN